MTDNAGTLHFSRVTRDDAGNYTCIASNGLQGQIRAHVQLTVAGATVAGPWGQGWQALWGSSLSPASPITH